MKEVAKPQADALVAYMRQWAAAFQLRRVYYLFGIGG